MVSSMNISYFRQVDISPKSERIVLGIDPGTNLLGYGIIRVNGKKNDLLTVGVLRLGKIDDAGRKLHEIYKKISGLIEGFECTEVAIEAPFFGKNVQSMLKLGRAQGVAIAAAIAKDLPVFEYVPRKIKQSICGNGNATKEQVLAMLTSEFKFEVFPETLDASDGLAAALCHVYQFSPRLFGETKGKGKSGWEGFVKNNPDRIK
jgi:crossover junction endodeoxyribonuclease RuvC